ncbi:hypothetical protein AHAS_Ahas17G0165000 [Arachis hypogaea]
MEAKLDDRVNRGTGIQEDASGGTHAETNETPTGDDNADSCDEGMEGEVTEYRDVLMLTEADMIRKVLCTDKATYEFYKRYGKCHGFGVRKGDSGKDDDERAHGVPTSKILGYMAGQAGGYSLMGFTKKDAYNYIEKSKREKIVDGDGNAAIIYLEGKAVSDPMCIARYSLTDNNMLANLF